MSVSDLCLFWFLICYYSNNNYYVLVGLFKRYVVKIDSYIVILFQVDFIFYLYIWCCKIN